MMLHVLAVGIIAIKGIAAYQVELSANQASYSCPADGGKTYTIALAGQRPIIYELRCGVGTKAAHLKNVDAPDLKSCADSCAAEAECYSCDYDAGARRCALKKVPGENIPYPIDTWYPKECPDVRSASPNANPLETTDLTCPFSDGKIFKAADGTWFYSQCCTDTSTSRHIGPVAAKDHADCVDLCAKNPECKSALYADNGGIQPENCKLYARSGHSSTFVDGGHFVYVTNPPTTETVLSEAMTCSTECPYADGQLYVSITGENYQMFCKKRHGTDYLKVDRRSSFETCLGACSMTPGCDSVDYEPRTQKCFYSNNQHAPAIDAPAFMSAYSLGCAGACGTCNGTAGSKLGTDPAEGDEPALSCADDDGELVTLETTEWHVRCDYCFMSNKDIPSSEGRYTAPGKSLVECARICAKDERCVGVNFMKDGKDICSLHTAGTVSNKFDVNLKSSTACDSIAPMDRGYAELVPS